MSRPWGWLVAAREVDWDALYADQLPRIHNFFRYRVGPGAVAEDLTSLTFEKAWTARHQYRHDLAAFSTWLFTIARNVAIDHYRARRPMVPLEDAGHLTAGESPETLAERRSDAEQLGRQLERLSERERELIALKYGAGLTNRAIAHATGLTATNVGTILHRAIAALRDGWPEGDRDG